MHNSSFVMVSHLLVGLERENHVLIRLLSQTRHCFTHEHFSIFGSMMDLPRADVPKPKILDACHESSYLPGLASPRQTILTESSTTSKGTYGFLRRLNGREVVSYHPPFTSIVRSSLSSALCLLTSLQIFHGGIDHPFSEDGDLSIEKSTIAFVKERLDVVDASIKFRDSVSSDIVQTAIVDQAHVYIYIISRPPGCPHTDFFFRGPKRMTFPSITRGPLYLSIVIIR